MGRKSSLPPLVVGVGGLAVRGDHSKAARFACWHVVDCGDALGWTLRDGRIVLCIGQEGSHDLFLVLLLLEERDCLTSRFLCFLCWTM